MHSISLNRQVAIAPLIHVPFNQHSQLTERTQLGAFVSFHSGLPEQASFPGPLIHVPFNSHNLLNPGQLDELELTYGPLLAIFLDLTESLFTAHVYLPYLETCSRADASGSGVFKSTSTGKS
jgi:hypothetical protein